MAKQSAGILLYRRRGTAIEVLLGHPGGPFWVKKDSHAWSIPKGEIEPGEDIFTTAKREFHEEIGMVAPEGEYLDLGSCKVSSGKQIFIWAIAGDLNVADVHSNTLQLEWPPKSGEHIEIPEIDRARWTSVATAPNKLHKGQDVFITRLLEQLHLVIPKPPEQQSLL